MSDWVKFLDSQIDELFRGWNTLSSVIVLLLFLYLVYPLLTAKEPDTHPFLLERQATTSPVRQKGQSAVYRNSNLPQGYPLCSGLGIKSPGSSGWGPGKDGDVRDIWRRAIDGKTDEKGSPSSSSGKILSLHGGETVQETDLQSVSKDINVIGSYIQSKGANCVAIYLPNSVEFLTAVFAAAFYGFHPVLIPFDKPSNVVLRLLDIANVDFIISTAGAISSKDIRSQCPKVREVMCVVEEASRDIDWTDASENSSTWHEVVEENASQSTSNLPANKEGDKIADFITLWLDESPTSGELVAFTQQNLVAAVGAQIANLPATQRMKPSDVFLPAESFTAPYILVETFAALFSNATLAINTVAGMDVPLTTVAQNVAPTIIAATAAQAYNLHDTTKSSVKSPIQKLALNSQANSLKAGKMPSKSAISKFTSPVLAKLSNKPGSLRLLYIFDRTNAEAPPTSTARLSEIRAFTGARVIHALTTAKVAGPIAQTSVYDYRIDEDQNAPGHFGVPPTCLELYVKDKGDHVTTAEAVGGELIARGPAVQNGEANLGIYVGFRADGCLTYHFQHPEKSA